MFHAKSIYLREQKAKYKDFIKKAGLRVKNERTQELKFDRKLSSKVTAESHKHHKDWLNIGAENSSLDTFEKYYKGMYNDGKEFKRLMIRNKEFKLLFRSNNFTDEQFSKCRRLYNEAEKRNFTASSHFMEQYVKRELNDKGTRFTVEDVLYVVDCEAKYLDPKTGRFIKEGRGIYILHEEERLITLRERSASKRWRRI